MDARANAGTELEELWEFSRSRVLERRVACSRVSIMPTAESANNPAIAVLEAQRAIRARCDFRLHDWPLARLHMPCQGPKPPMPSGISRSWHMHANRMSARRDLRGCFCCRNCCIIPRSTLPFRHSEWQDEGNVPTKRVWTGNTRRHSNQSGARFPIPQFFEMQAMRSTVGGRERPWRKGRGREK